MTSLQKAIVRTLCYSDVFGYPLTAYEMWKYLISDKTFEKHEVLSTLKKEKKLFFSSDGYYCLPTRQRIIAQRKERKRISEEKVHKARKAIQWLSFVPSVQLIGISGSVAMHNAEMKDDIDLFIITSAETVWITRLLLLGIVEVSGMRRKRTEKNEQDKLCLNFLMDERAIPFPKQQQDMYTAHEIVQMLVVFERNNMYARFLKSNKWVTRCMPNSFDALRTTSYEIRNTTINPVSLLERLVRRVQIRYMASHKTTEVTTQTIAAFHPIDYRGKILKLYKKRLLEKGVED